MSNLSVFDIIGPVMVGPSSSHTAGATRLGQVARSIFGKEPKELKIILHGSFGIVYKGHCTDKALIGGLLGMDPDDDNLKNAMEIATQKKIKFSFEAKNLGLGFHPNTARMYLKNDQHQMHITGSSIGGGNIIITNINGFDVKFSGDYSILLISHKNLWGISSKLMKIFSENRYDIINMNTSHPDYEGQSLTVTEMEQSIPREIIPFIERMEGVKWVRIFNHPSHFNPDEAKQV